MIRTSILIFFILICTVTQAQDSLAYKQGWILTRNYPLNNFDSISEHFAPIFPWGPYTGGDHALTYNYENVNVLNNSTSIEAIKKIYQGELWMIDSAGNFFTKDTIFQYTSGLLYSKEEHQYGQFEITFKGNKTDGTVGAFWLYGADNEEIDVFEIRGTRENRAQMTLHWEDRDPITRSKQSIYNVDLEEGIFADDFYTIGVIWNENEILWTFEGDTVKVDAFTQFIRNRHIPKNKLNLIMSLEVGTSDGIVDSINFSEQIFFKDLRAYTDTLGITPPQIIKQNELLHNFNEPFTIKLKDLEVKNHYENYPFGFKLGIHKDSTNNFSVNDEGIIVDNPLLSQLSIPVYVENGKQKSEVFYVLVKNKTISSIKQNLEKLVSLLELKDGKLALKNSSNSDLKLRLIEQNGKLISPWQNLSAKESIQLEINKKSAIIQLEQKGVITGKLIFDKP